MKSRRLFKQNNGIPRILHTIIPQKLRIYYLLCWWAKVGSLKYIMLNYKDGLKSNPKSFRSKEKYVLWKRQSQKILKARQTRQPIAGVKMERVRWGEMPAGLRNWEWLSCGWLIRQHLRLRPQGPGFCQSRMSSVLLFLEPPERERKLAGTLISSREMLRWESAESTANSGNKWVWLHLRTSSIFLYFVIAVLEF